MRKLSLSLLLGLFAMTAAAQQVTVQVRNNTSEQRQELVEIDAKTVYKKLGIAEGRHFRVINAVRQEVIYQITYDGKTVSTLSVSMILPGRTTVAPTVCTALPCRRAVSVPLAMMCG